MPTSTPLSGIEIARREGGRIVIRPGGARARWEMNDLLAADGHAMRVVFGAAVRALDEAAERKLLEEAFLSSATTVTSQDVAAYFAETLKSAARRQVALHDAAEILSDAGRGQLSAAMADAGRAVAFGCGIELLPPFELEVDSPSLRQEQEERRRGAAQGERLNRAAAWFRQFQEIRAGAPDLGAEKILQRMGTLDPAEQAEMLRGLLLSAAGESARRPLWVVAGPQLLKFESNGAAGEVPQAQVFSPPDALGPFRSVQRAELDGKPVLLIGAQRGVLVVDPTSPREAVAYADPTITSNLGFNAAAITGGRIWATHGEAGLVSWEIAQTDKPVSRSSGGSTSFSPRNLCLIDGNRLVFSSDSRLFERGADEAIRPVNDSQNNGPAATIVSIIAEPGGNLLIVREDGQLSRRQTSDLTISAQSRRTGRVSAAGQVPWLGSVRLLVATEEGPVACVGVEDEIVTHYLSGYTALRQTAATADRVAAVSADRQRLILWPTWDGRKPAAEIHIAAIARHRVADIEFG
ncbi:MAG: hypothetical protein ABSH22_05665 [Tepidisphaeraceae bacterium]|jgi:hypothetical protein